MAFLLPEALLLFLPLGAALVLLHRSLPRRRRVVVPSLYLWSRLASLPVRSAPRSPRLSLQLLLQLLALAAVLAALARPVSVRAGPPPGLLVVILDRTLSMAAAGRWPQALERVRELSRAAGSQGSLTLVLLDDRPRVAYRGPAASPELERLLAEIRPGGVAQGLGEAWSLARAEQAWRVALVTDGGLGGRAPHELEVHLVGQALANQAIIALEAAPLPAGGHQVFLRVANWSAEESRRPVILLDGEQILHQELAVMPPEGLFEASWRIPPGAGALEARLGGEDGHPADDRAAVSLRGGLPVALLPADGVEAEPLRFLRALRPEARGVPIRVLAGDPPLQLPSGGMLLLAPGPFQKAAGPWSAEPSALLQDLPLEQLAGLNVSRAGPPPGLQPILQDGQGRILLAQADLPPARLIWLGLQLDSLAISRTAVVLLVERLLSALGPPSAPATAPAGSLVEIEPRPWLETLQVQGPQGAWEVPAGAELRLPAAGLHRIEGVGELAVQPSSGRETDLRRRLSARPAEPPGEEPRQRELAPWLALAGAVLLAVEAGLRSQRQLPRWAGWRASSR